MSEIQTSPQNTPDKDVSQFDLDALKAARSVLERATAVVATGALLTGAAAAASEQGDQRSRLQAIAAEAQANPEEEAFVAAIKEAAHKDPTDIQDNFTLESGDTVLAHAESIAITLPDYQENPDVNDRSLHVSASEFSVVHPGDEFVIGKTVVNDKEYLVVQEAPEDYVDPDTIEPIPEEGLPTPVTH